MRKLLSLPMGIIVLWLTVSNAVFAQGVNRQTNLPQFEGFYAGIGVGRGVIEDPYYELSRRTGLPNGWSGQHDDQSNTFTLSFGRNWNFDQYVIGLEGRLQRRSFSDHSYQIDNTGNVDTDNFTTYESDLSKQVLVRLGRLLDVDHLAYVAIGRVQTDYRRSYTTRLGAGASDTISGMDHGTILGVGFERMIGANLSFRGELTHVRYDQTVNNPTAWPNINNYHDAKESAVMLSLIRHF